MAKTVYRNIRFDSGTEMRRYRDVLRPLELAGEIVGLEVHPQFTLLGVNGHRIGDAYTADFRYVELPAQKEVVEDVKGRMTRHGWAKTRDLFADNYPSIEFRIVQWQKGRWLSTVAKPRSKRYKPTARQPQKGQDA